jgi:surface antigen
MRLKKLVLIFMSVSLIGGAIAFVSKKINMNPFYKVGEHIDSLNDVIVYYNGGIDMIEERHLTIDGYNLGLKYQCVEFVKRYYFQQFNHRMPDSYGHAMSFFEASLKDGQLNKARGLTQYTNNSKSKPEVNDLLVFGKTFFNKYGHVAIVSNVGTNQIEIIQQNPGPFGSSREHFDLVYFDKKWLIKDEKILGWLRKE